LVTVKAEYVSICRHSRIIEERVAAETPARVPSGAALFLPDQQ